MVKFIAIASGRAKGAWMRFKPRGGGLHKVLILVVLAFILAGGASPAQGQRATPEQMPPRPQHKTDPWPWFLAFILLGVAWYPAFKNSKRELEP